MTQTLSPAQVVERSGFSLDTLRYYERIGLLDGIGRSASGHRRFSQDHLEWLGVLRCLRDTGMPIAEMCRYAESARGGSRTMAERLALLTAHEERVERHIAELRAQQDHLREKIAWYREQLADTDQS
ncbi:MerR family transcriptional regulator [Peterkaempfera griseoplana]|uniref:MerR family transcriptional regulator n=1 Tax=Peterkaempfera griseoplana TaxID=66896 RepID=UPI0006E3CB5E|nr:MerR family transcriptional regulator [Peterkaempfera griseoplana]